MPPKIDNYFAPKSSTSPQSNSGKRCRNSPEQTKQGFKRVNSVPSTVMSSSNSLVEQEIGSMSKSELMKAMSDLMTQLLDSKLKSVASKDDINNFRKDFEELRLENHRLSEEVAVLKEAFSKHETQLEVLDRKARRGNVVIRGLKCQPEADPSKAASDFFHQVLGIEVGLNELYCWVKRVSC